MIRIVCLALLFAAGLSASAADSELVLLPTHPLPAGLTEKTTITNGVARITNVTQPSLTIYPAKTKGTDSAPLVVVCPGGGYNVLAWNHEGNEVVAWLNGLGYSAAVLKYTVPDRIRDSAYLDATRAVAYLRANAERLRISKLGMMGFSAGGHLTARVACSDTAPDFAILVYPAYIEDKNGKFDPKLSLSKKIPPSFVIQSQDDYHYIDAAFGWHREMRKLRIPCELHIFSYGGHGYGLGSRFKGKGPAQWPALCEAWIKRQR